MAGRGAGACAAPAAAATVESMRVAIVGGGPAGSLLAHELARGRRTGDRLRRVAPAREALRRRAHAGCAAGCSRPLRRRPAAGPPRRRVPIRLGRGAGGRRAPRPARARRRAAASSTRGCCGGRSSRARAHRAERVVAVDAEGGVRTADGRAGEPSTWSSAPTAPGSLVRRTLLGPTATGRLLMAARLARATATRRCSCASRPASPATSGSSRGRATSRSASARRSAPCPRAISWPASMREAARSFPALAPPGPRPPGPHDPVPRRRTRHSLRRSPGRAGRSSGTRAALADPVTGEGICYALRSARLLAETLLERRLPRAATRSGCSPTSAASSLRAARAARRGSSRPGFPHAHGPLRRTQRRGAGACSAELVLGEQGYLGLEWRLLRAGPRFLLDSVRERARWPKPPGDERLLTALKRVKREADDGNGRQERYDKNGHSLIPVDSRPRARPSSRVNRCPERSQRVRDVRVRAARMAGGSPPTAPIVSANAIPIASAGRA